MTHVDSIAASLQADSFFGQPVAESAFIKWTGWTLWQLQRRKHLSCYRCYC